MNGLKLADALKQAFRHSRDVVGGDPVYVVRLAHTAGKPARFRTTTEGDTAIDAGEKHVATITAETT